MGARKPKFKQYLYESMKKLDTFNFDVLVFQEVNSYWAEEAQAHLNALASSQGIASSQGPAWLMVHDDKVNSPTSLPTQLSQTQPSQTQPNRTQPKPTQHSRLLRQDRLLVAVHHVPGRALR